MPIDKLSICRSTRKFASEAFLKSLKSLLNRKSSISEKDLAEEWLSQLRTNSKIFPEGWFIPPPHGITVLFGTDKRVERVCPKTIRLEEFWPRNNIYLDKNNGIALVYTSPVDKKTGIIGDFGMAIYFGKDKRIQKYLKNCLKINKEIFSQVKAGKEFSEVSNYANKILDNYGFENGVLSLSDPAKTNIGHTIPFSYENMTSEEKKVLDNGDKDWETTKNMIAKKRKFVSSIESFKITKGMGFTLEPRPYITSDNKIPRVWYHAIVLIKENGEKELLTNFDEIFKFTRMDDILNNL